MSEKFRITPSGDVLLSDNVNTRLPVITDGIIAHFPFDGSTKGIGYKNLLDYSTWVIGSTGSQPGFPQNGDGNKIINDIGPDGKYTAIWQSINNDEDSNADGGWNGDRFPIDNTKLYRFSVWIKRVVLGNGSYYLGLNSYDDSITNIGVIKGNDGTSVSTNPYFKATSWNKTIMPLDDWFLMVGHVHPVGTGIIMHEDSGIYNILGEKVTTITRDFIWQANNTQAKHRTYLYSSTIPQTDQRWAYPRVDLCDGSEPSLEDLIKTEGNVINPYINTNTYLFEDKLLIPPATTNKFTTPNFDTTSSTGGWSHWNASGGIGSCNQNTNKKFIFGEQNYSHWFANDKTATGSYLLYQVPSTDGVETTRTLTAILCMEDCSDIIDETQVYPSWNAGIGTPARGYWTSIERIGNSHFFLCKVEGFTQSGTNDLVGLYIRPGYKAYVSFMQVEHRLFSSVAPTITTRAESVFALKNVLNPRKGTVLIDVTFHEDNTINDSNGTSSDQYCFKNDLVGNYNQANVFIFHDTDWWWIRDSDNIQHSLYLNLPIVRNERSKIALVYDDSYGIMRMYKNGVIAAGRLDTNMIGLLGNLNPDWIHSYSSSGNYKMAQSLHGLTFYDRPLSADEIFQLQGNKALHIGTNGDLYTESINTEKLILANDIKHYPLTQDKVPKIGTIEPSVDLGNTFDDGYLWCGDANVNLVDMLLYHISGSSAGFEDIRMISDNEFYLYTSLWSESNYLTVDVDNLLTTTEYICSFEYYIYEDSESDLRFDPNGTWNWSIGLTQREKWTKFEKVFTTTDTTSTDLHFYSTSSGLKIRAKIRNIQIERNYFGRTPYANPNIPRNVNGRLEYQFPDIIKNDSDWTIGIFAFPNKTIMETTTTPGRSAVLTVGRYYVVDESDASWGYNWNSKDNPEERYFQIIGYNNKIGKYSSSVYLSNEEMNDWVFFTMRYDSTNNILYGDIYTVKDRYNISVSNRTFDGLEPVIMIGGYEWDKCAWNSYVKDFIITDRMLPTDELSNIYKQNLNLLNNKIITKGKIHTEEIL